MAAENSTSFPSGQIGKIGAPILLILAMVWSSCNKQDISRYMVKKGDFQSVITETGELQAVNARVVSMPYIGWRYGWNFKITGLVEHGTIVNQGDSIAQFDGSTVKTWLMERQNRYEVEKVALNKLMVEQHIRLQNIASQIETSQATYNLKKLQVEKFIFESERKKLVKQKELEKAETELKKTQDKHKFTKAIIENELKIQQIKVRQLESDIDHAKAALAELTVKSPINGMVQILENRRSRNNYQVGDDVSQGQPFVSVPDMSRMKVKSTVSEDDYFKIQEGQKVIVRLDAFPLLKFEGTLIDVSKLSRKKNEKSTVKVFDILILLSDSDPVLKPGMTVSCDIYASELPDVYYVENECIFNDTINYILIDKGGRHEKFQINTGPRNSKFTVITGEVEEGWKLVPNDKRTKTEI